MENSWESRSEKMRRLFDKTLEAGTWTGILLSHMIKDVIPSPLRKGLERYHQHFDDRRYDRRLRVKKTINGFSNGKELKDIHLINISSGGMYVEVDPANAEVGPEVFFNLSGKNLGPIMRVKGRVTRRTERGMAIQFL
jgi:PilZ domain